MKSHSCLRSYLANGGYEERKDSFLQRCGPERLPVLSSVPHPVHGTARMYKQAALNGLHGYLYKESTCSGEEEEREELEWDE